MFLFFLIYILSPISLTAWAQTEQKEILVEATPLKSFSQKTDAWPSDTVSQEILETQGGSLYDSLQKYPGLQSQGESSSGSPSIRIRGSGSAARNLILLDGSPINTQDGLGANPLLLPAESLESIEIIKGPATLFYGSDAIGGALNLVPKKFERFSFGAGYESANKTSLTISSPLIKKEAHYLGGSIYLENSDGDFSYNDPQQGRRDRAFNKKQRQRYFLSGENKISDMKLSHHLIFAKEHGQTPGEIPFSATNVNNFDRTAFLGSIGATKRIYKNSDLKLKTSHSRTDNNNNQGGSATSYFSSQNTFSASFENYSIDPIAIEFITDFTQDAFRSDFVSSEKLDDQHFEHALIVKSQISESDYLLAGVRFFPDENTFSKNILLKQDNKNHLLWMSYSEGLRLPSLTQKFANISGFVGNPNLLLEKSSQVELGAEIPNLSRNLSFKVSGYFLDYENFIEFLSTPSPYSYENRQEATVRGVDLQLRRDYKIYHGVLAYSFMDSEIESSGLSMTLAPEHQVYFLLGAQLSALIFELHNTYWSTYRLDQTTESDWWVTDFTLRGSGFADWEFKAGVLNILDVARVFTRSSTGFYPEPGRQYFIFAKKYF